MIKCADHMYFDDFVQKKQRRIRKALSSGKLKYNVYCIALSTNPNSLLDVMNVNELRFDYYKNQDIYILGLAKGRKSAFAIVQRMVDEVYQNTGDVKLREYYKDRWDT